MNVTLLSGFLGAGKTTLLKRILESHAHGLKIAVVVNDMGELNIDAKEIKQHKLVQEKAEMVELQNGCICCTLRGDLLRTVKRLSEEKTAQGAPAYDYLVVESTGIAEPLPVAQTFVMDVNTGEFSADDAANAAETETEFFEPLSKYARLDTLVTVVDAFNVLQVLGEVESLASRQKLLGAVDAETNCKDTTSEAFQVTMPGAVDDAADDDEEAEEEEEAPTLAQLLLDQLEVANVILLNKVDLLHPSCAARRHEEILQIRSLVRRLNPEARVMVPGYEFDFGAKQAPLSSSAAASAADKGAVGTLGLSKFKGFDVAQVLNTQLFDMAAAEASAGWAKELNKEVHGGGHTPETEEYGIGSFLWRTDTADPRPFHPGRLHNILCGFGELLPPSTRRKHTAKRGTQTQTKAGKEVAPKDHDDHDDDADGPVFRGVVRSKGTLWLAYGHAIPIGIHTAGRQLELTPNVEYSFLAAVPRGQWGEEDYTQQKEHAARGRWHTGEKGTEGRGDDGYGHYDGDDGDGFGDRASELVCIGVDMTEGRKRRIAEALNGALLTDGEMAEGVKAFKEKGEGGDDDHPWKALPDPFFGGTGAATCWELGQFDEDEGDEDEEGA